MQTKELHAANKTRWEAAAPLWAKGADSRGLWQRCPDEPELALSANEMKYLGDLTCKQVCVLGSGDNEAAFALAGMGGHVTSVDISQGQMDVAAERAKELGLEMSFLRADVVDLSALQDGTFDVVYTGGHVAVWVADLQAYYSEAARVLKPGGLFMIKEYHPFRRIWKTSTDEMVVESSYYERGPFEYDLDEDILAVAPGPLKSYEFHWTMSDMLNAVMNAGCELVFVDEFGEKVCDWEGSPMHGLPENVVIVGRRLE